MTPEELRDEARRLRSINADLLAALEEMVGQFNFIYRDDEDARVLDAAVAAIARATGG